jgi:integrase/recombinase XerD
MYRFERNVSVQGLSRQTFINYSRYVSALALYYKKLPTELSADEVHDYLYFLQQRSSSPSLSYFKFTIFGLRFMLRTEELSYNQLKLPSIRKEKKLQVVLSKAEVWRLIHQCKSLKHKILIGLLYGCGLRCMEVRSVRLQDLDFDRKSLLVKQGKGKKDRYVPLSPHLIRGLKKYIRTEEPVDYLFNGKPRGRAGGDFDGRYSQRGVQWIVSQAGKQARILKPINVHTLRHTFATHLLEDGMDIVTLKDLLGHSRIETTFIYLQIAQLSTQKIFSPLDTLCSRFDKKGKIKIFNK